MMAEILNGRKLALQMCGALTERVAMLSRPPHLAVILVGENSASQIYVRMKRKAAQAVGIQFTLHELPQTTAEADLLTLIQQLNADTGVDGILLQLPLPGKIDEAVCLQAIAPHKDVDGLHPQNIGLTASGAKEGLWPCTALGVMHLVKQAHGEDLTGLNAVVVGRSNLVGKPTARLLLAANATVTVCHSRTKDLAQITSTADILISAIGKAGMITAQHVKAGATVIDVGISRRSDAKGIYGDVDFDAVSQIAGALTPVPGGVGPLTVAFLLDNVVRAAIG